MPKLVTLVSVLAFVAAQSLVAEDGLKACAAAGTDPDALSSCYQMQMRLEKRFRTLWSRPEPEKPLRRSTVSTLAPLTQLELEDRDRDGKADFFAYYPEGGSRRTQEFGAFFDLNRDGRPDWMVYYGGMLATKAMDFYAWYHHAVDTNGDGRFDLRIYEAIDLDGDSMPEREASAWLFDIDSDGLADKALRVDRGNGKAIATDKDGLVQMGYLLESDPAKLPHIGQPIPTALFDQIAADIVTAEHLPPK